jgi:hypothetical protein
MTDAHRQEATGPTGDDRVDAAVARLKDLDTVPVDDHVRVYHDIHARLGAVLGRTGEPVDTADRDPLGSADPLDPVDHADPADPVDPLDPVDPADPADAGGTAARGEADLQGRPADAGG